MQILFQTSWTCCPFQTSWTCCPFQTYGLAALPINVIRRSTTAIELSAETVTSTKLSAEEDATSIELSAEIEVALARSDIQAERKRANFSFKHYIFAVLVRIVLC